MIHQVAMNTPNAKTVASCCHFLAKKTGFLREAGGPQVDSRRLQRDLEYREYQAESKRSNLVGSGQKTQEPISKGFCWPR